MKYMVMECHEAYAVLMDESSRFVTAANLHYSVGQTVTNPVILNEDNSSAKRQNFIITRFAAAAACLLLIGGTGYSYYAKNYKTCSTVLLSTGTDIQMGLNKKGEVISISSDSEYGKELLKEYSGSSKDMLTVANEILELEMSKGIVNDGDTVDLYISAPKSEIFNSYKSELENGISDLKIKVDVHKHDEHPVPKKDKETEKNPVKPPVPNDEKVKPPVHDEKTEAVPPVKNDKIPAVPPVVNDDKKPVVTENIPVPPVVHENEKPPVNHENNMENNEEKPPVEHGHNAETPVHDEHFPDDNIAPPPHANENSDKNSDLNEVHHDSELKFSYPDIHSPSPAEVPPHAVGTPLPPSDTIASAVTDSCAD